MQAVARTAVLARALPAPVRAMARTAVLAQALESPVLAVARTAVLALALGSPVLAVLGLGLALPKPLYEHRCLHRIPHKETTVS